MNDRYRIIKENPSIPIGSVVELIKLYPSRHDLNVVGYADVKYGNSRFRLLADVMSLLQDDAISMPRAQ